MTAPTPGPVPDHDRFFRFQIDPVRDGIDEPCRVVVHDRAAGDFCARHVLQAGETWEGSLRDLSPNPFSLKVKLQVMRDGRWQDHVRYRPLLQEQVFEDELKYLFFPRPGARRLIVVFQAINTRQSYNYIGTLSDLNAHRLYIKDDYGSDPLTRSSYYLGPNRSLTIADKVQRLIAQIRQDWGLPARDVITAGSSKGGYAAIYHGLRAGAGDVIAGGPQIMLGSYLNTPARDSVLPPILEYLAGSVSAEAEAWANSILVDLLRSRTGWPTTVHFHVGTGEPHYERHALPFKALAQEQGLQVAWDLRSYDTHEELAAHFPVFLSGTLAVLAQKKTEIQNAHRTGSCVPQSARAKEQAHPAV